MCLSTSTHDTEVVFCTFQTYTLHQGFKAMAKQCQSSQHQFMDIVSYKWGHLGQLTSHIFHDKRTNNAVKNLHQLTQHHLTYENTQNLTFRGLCIVMYSYNERQWDALQCQIYLIKYSTCFRQVHCPSSGVSQHCIHTTGICHANSVGVC